MDVNQYKAIFDEKKQKYLDQYKTATESANRSGGFGTELGEAIKQRNDTYATLDNDANSKREGYYNSASVLPELFEKYKDNPLYALKAYSDETANRGTIYRNAEDNRERKKGRVEDFITSYTKAAAEEAARQERLMNVLKEELGFAEQDYERARQEDEARRARAAAAAQYAAQLAALTGGSGVDNTLTENPNQTNNNAVPLPKGVTKGSDGKPIEPSSYRGPIGTESPDGTMIITGYFNGQPEFAPNPKYREKKGDWTDAVLGVSAAGRDFGGKVTNFAKSGGKKIGNAIGGLFR